VWLVNGFNAEIDSRKKAQKTQKNSPARGGPSRAPVFAFPRRRFRFPPERHFDCRLEEHSVFLATVAEQTAVAEVLSDMDAELAALEQRRDKTRALK
jgi:hypothetical protein